MRREKEMLRNTLVVLSAMAVCTATASAAMVVVLDDNADGYAYQEPVATANPGTWTVKAGPATYYESDKMRLVNGSVIRSVGEWNPEGDDVYDPSDPSWTAYPPGTPKPVVLSFEVQMTDSLQPRLSVAMRNSDRGSIEFRGLRIEIRPNQNEQGLYIETSGSGLADNGSVYGVLNTDGSTAPTRSIRSRSGWTASAGPSSASGSSS